MPGKAARGKRIRARHERARYGFFIGEPMSSIGNHSLFRLRELGSQCLVCEDIPIAADNQNHPIAGQASRTPTKQRGCQPFATISPLGQDY